MRRSFFLSILLASVAGLATAMTVRANEPVVRAVLFYSPSCSHCHQALNDVVQPLAKTYGERLELVLIDASLPDGQILLQSAAQSYGLERTYVPTLIVGEVVLVGTLEIQDEFPALIETHLAQGGIDWPDIPGLAEALGAAPATAPGTSVAATATVAAAAAAHAVPTAQPTATRATAILTPGAIFESAPQASLSARLARDPAGNALAIIVLAGLLYTVGRVTLAVLGRRSPGLPQRALAGWLVPGLTLFGLLIAGYLAYVETAQVEATCGPVGDCNTVQQSPYARLFGVLPIGVLGFAGYSAISLTWVIARNTRGRWADLALAGLWGMTYIGTLFSIYLTFLEPFVIGATCTWCLASAMVIASLLWIAAEPGRDALIRINQRRAKRRAAARV